MDRMEELRKAIEAAAGRGEELLKKSQMAFDFNPTAKPNPHHRAYTRTSARGTVSNVEAKGAPDHRAMVVELHDAYERHDRRGRGGLGIDPDHPDYNTPEKYLDTAKLILKYRSYERFSKRGQDEVKGMLNRHIDELAEHLEGTKHEAKESPAQEAAEHDEQPVLIRRAHTGRTFAIPPRP